MVLVKFGGESIELDYSNYENARGINIIVHTEKEVANLGEEYEQEYRIAEEETMLYFLQRARKKIEDEWDDKLRRISGIKQLVCLSPVNGHFVLEFALKGIAE